MTDETSLADLQPGETGTIVRIIGKSPFKEILLEMGLVKGEVVQKVKLAPLADPAEYIVKGYHVSLRREEASDVVVQTD